MALAGFARGFDGRKASIFGTFANFTAFGWISKILFAKENLLSRGPDKLVCTINAFDRKVYEFIVVVDNSYGSFRSSLKIAV